MEPDMSIRNRNALGLFRLISASYDMLPPSAIRRDDIPGVRRTGPSPFPASPGARLHRRMRGVVPRYRRAGGALEVNARCAACSRIGRGTRRDAMATRCRDVASPETWRAVDNAAIRRLASARPGGGRAGALASAVPGHEEPRRVLP